MTNTSEPTLSQKLRNTRLSGDSIETKLRTDERVLARVTDGIYREPGSALRELISNAYDADANFVNIATDAPRFDQIRIDDDGSGMTPEVLSHLLESIGGSAKRTPTGHALGITQQGDTSRSPGGRKLIGKLGIGLFSVSQLTHTFQIVTKRSGDDFRSVATVKLNQFSDAPNSEANSESFEAGQARLWIEPASNLNEHGTSIILNSIRPRTRETLQSSDVWDAIIDPGEDGLDARKFLPEFHIGRVDRKGNFVDPKSIGQETAQSLPWGSESSPSDAFTSMVDAVWASAAQGVPNPKLDQLFDNYLKMLWDLSLSLPLDYYKGHLFDHVLDETYADFFEISNHFRGSATRVDHDSASTLRTKLGLKAGAEPNNFNVRIDQVLLRRPLRYDNLPVTNHALKKPIIFVGKMSENFEGFDKSVSAGPLSFEAYFFWNPKIAPVDHRGALVRIHEASGKLFDETFFRYQVSEQTRLRQITCEIFVSTGLESALNIDREAFNVAHPHMVVLTKWVHSALRQLATTQKSLAREVRDLAKKADANVATTWLEQVISEANASFSKGEEAVPEIQFHSTLPARKVLEGQDPSFAYSFPEKEVLRVDKASVDTAMLAKVEAIAKILSIYGVLESLSTSSRNSLMRSITDILRGSDV